MRILELIASVDPATGGPIEGLLRQVEAATPHGVVSEVASLDDPRAPYVAACPVKVHALGPAKLLSHWVRYGYAPRLAPWLETHVHDYDAVIVHGLWQYHSFAAWRVLRTRAVPYFVYTHGMLDPWFKRAYPLKHLKKWLYWPWGDYRVLRDAKAVLFTCEEERVLARRSFWLYRAREEVVGFGTTTGGGDANVQRETFLGRFPALRGKRLILFLGRIHPKKGCDALIEAFAAVTARDPSLQLVFAGPDQVGWQRELAAQARARGIEDRITWTGMLHGDAKWGAYRAADAFALPSHQENFGVVVAEALACGVPVLISDKVNIWREIEQSGAGLVASDDAAGTRRLLESWLDAPAAERETMRRRAVQCFRDHFDVQAAIGRLHRVLRAA